MLNLTICYIENILIISNGYHDSCYCINVINVINVFCFFKSHRRPIKLFATIFSRCSTVAQIPMRSIGSHASATAAPGSSVLRGRSIPKGPKVSSAGSFPAGNQWNLGSNHLKSGEKIVVLP